MKHGNLLPNKACDTTALHMIEQQFGRIHANAQALTTYVLNMHQLASTKTPLHTLVIIMPTCIIPLSYPGMSAALNLCGNHLRVVGYAPIKEPTTTTAEELMLMDEEPTFEDVLQLVEATVSVMGLELDQFMFGSNRPFFVEGHRVAAPRSAGYSSRCGLCDGAHLLDSCTMFTDMHIEDLISYIKLLSYVLVS